MTTMEQEVLEDWERCLLLVENLEDDHLRVVPETVERLRQISDPIRCISFNGPYRTGKSHLLNLLISIVFKRNNVFPVGNTVEAMTKGIWIWAGRHPHPDDSSWIIFMDTEGLCDVQKGDNLNDLQSFILSLLLSSTFVYNSLGTIDYQALEKLHYVSSLAEKIRLRSDSSLDEEELGHDLIFPSFVWIVRDFHLMKSADGRELTDDGYLEKALRTRHDALSVGQLSVKRCLKEYFPSRRCFTLPRLVGVEKGRDGDIDHQTLLSPLTQHILTAPLKIYNGNRITGRVLGRLAEAFVPAVLTLEDFSHSRICVEDIMTRIVDVENSKVLARCFETYRASLRREAAEVQDSMELFSIHFDLVTKVNMSFMSSAVHPIQSHYLQLTEKIKKEFEEMCERKSLELKATCEEIWQRTRVEVIEEIQQFVVVGGYKSFKERVEKLKTMCEKERIFHCFEGRCFLAKKLTELEESEGKLIMAADKVMTDLQKQQEERRLEDERKLEEAKLAGEAEKKTEKLVENSKKYEKSATETLKRSFDEMQREQNVFLEERVQRMNLEMEDLKDNGLEEEKENRMDRMEAYKKMMANNQVATDSKWLNVGTAIGQIVGAALSAFLASFNPPSELKSISLSFNR